jgi:hypothetical protein
MSNRLALAPPATDTAVAREWLARYRSALEAAHVLVLFAEADALEGRPR